MPASNSLTYFQFGTRKPNTALPAWSQDSNIYKGTFQPPANCAVTKTTSDRRPASNLATAAKPSGKVTYGFLQALLRAAMVYNGCDSDAFGFSNEYLVAEYTKNNTSEGKQVGPGELITIAINRSNGSVFARSGSSAYKI